MKTISNLFSLKLCLNYLIIILIIINITTAMKLIDSRMESDELRAYGQGIVIKYKELKINHYSLQEEMTELTNLLIDEIEPPETLKIHDVYIDGKRVRTIKKTTMNPILIKKLYEIGLMGDSKVEVKTR